jgi:hypothetical protein
MPIHVLGKDFLHWAGRGDDEVNADDGVGHFMGEDVIVDAVDGDGYVSVVVGVEGNRGRSKHALAPIDGGNLSLCFVQGDVEVEDGRMHIEEHADFFHNFINLRFQKERVLFLAIPQEAHAAYWIPAFAGMTEK